MISAYIWYIYIDYVDLVISHCSQKILWKQRVGKKDSPLVKQWASVTSSRMLRQWFHLFPGPVPWFLPGCTLAQITEETDVSVGHLCPVVLTPHCGETVRPKAKRPPVGFLLSVDVLSGRDTETCLEGRFQNYHMSSCSMLAPVVWTGHLNSRTHILFVHEHTFYLDGQGSSSWFSVSESMVKDNNHKSIRKQLMLWF